MTTETLEKAAAAGEISLLDAVIDQGRMIVDVSQRPYARDLVFEFVDQVLVEEAGSTFPGDVALAINDKIAEIDEILSDQVNAILHHPEFQKLEATWRGLRLSGPQHRDRRLAQDPRAQRRRRRSCSRTWRRPPSSTRARSSRRSTRRSTASSAARRSACWSATTSSAAIRRTWRCSRRCRTSPRPRTRRSSPAPRPRCSTWRASPSSASRATSPRSSRASRYAKWQSFRESEDSRYVALALPHMLMRLPYGPGHDAGRGVQLSRRTSTAATTSKYLWGNAAYGLAPRITDAFAKYGWCAAIRGVEGGGLVEGLPTHTFRTDEGDIALKCPTEIAITDRREKELDRPGLHPPGALQGHRLRRVLRRPDGQQAEGLQHRRGQRQRAAVGAAAVHLCVSRFAHYLKAMMRDKIGSFMSRRDVRDFLNGWITQYVLCNDDAGQESRRSTRCARRASM